MNILLTNDDGYNADGILALYHLLKQTNDVILVAPDRERSGIGHGITLNRPLRIKKLDPMGIENGYSVTGTPVDCIKLGLSELCRTKPDLVISGINPGSNTGININYSGTAGAAREAALNGMAAMAVSAVKFDKPIDYEGIAQFTSGVAGKLGKMALPDHTFLNLNFPTVPVREARGVKITRQAVDNISEDFEKRMDPRKNPYYWYGSAGKGVRDDEGKTDVGALKMKYISISPILCDMTDYTVLRELDPVRLTGLS